MSADSPSASAVRRESVRLIVAVLLASTLAAFLSSPAFEERGVWSSSPRLDTAFIVVWGPLLAWAMARWPLAVSLRTYLVLSLFIEPFSEAMLRDRGGGYWDTVLWPAAVAYFGTLKEFSGLPGASLPVFFFVTLGLLVRGVQASRAGLRSTPSRLAMNMLRVFFAATVVLFLWGIANGGKVESAFRQTVHLLQLPLVAAAFVYILRIPEDLVAVGTIVVVTALCRALLVAYVYFGVCVPQGITERPGLPEWCTNHSDSVLFVTAILIVMTAAIEARTRRALMQAAAVTLALLFAIVLNHRRLAFVSLAMAPIPLYMAFQKSPMKRRVSAALAVLVPVALAYVAVGSKLDSSSVIVQPAKLAMSIFDARDTSNLSRDIENENLIYTLSLRPLLSTGFGFDYQYSPQNPPVDLTEVFANYRLIAHNGVLWMWSWGGLAGFTILWMLFPVAGALAMSGYRAASTPVERVAALSALGAISVCIVQIWGDQGLNGYMVPMIFGLAFATSAQLASRSSA
jgi:hypothetical protein